MINILIGCWGATCRSPMAKAFLDRELGQRRIEASTLARAIFEPSCATAHELAVDVMRNEDLDISDHRPTRASDAEAAWADIIFVMDRETLAEAQRRWPAHHSKIVLIREFADGSSKDICDPLLDLDLYKLRRNYEHTAVRLRRAAKAIAERLATGVQAD